MGRPVHHRGVELDHPFLVGNAAKADGAVGWVGLDDRDARDRGVKRVGPGPEQLHRLLDGSQAIVAGNHDRLVISDRLGGRGTQRRGSQAQGAHGQERTAVQRLGHLRRSSLVKRWTQDWTGAKRLHGRSIEPRSLSTAPGPILTQTKRRHRASRLSERRIFPLGFDSRTKLASFDQRRPPANELRSAKM